MGMLLMLEWKVMWVKFEERKLVEIKECIIVVKENKEQQQQRKYKLIIM